jgi:hypothetical protein
MRYEIRDDLECVDLPFPRFRDWLHAFEFFCETKKDIITADFDVTFWMIDLSTNEVLKEYSHEGTR